MTKLEFRPQHPSFVAEVIGADFSNPTPELGQQLKEGLAKYGVLICRETGLDNERHIALSKLFGELDDMGPYYQKGRVNRLPLEQLFDVSNINADGTIMQPDSYRAVAIKGNNLFHVDSAFNPRRAGPSLLLAHILPPQGLGGNTEYCDTRAAYEDLDDETKDQIKDYILWHSHRHSRRMASPGHPALAAPEFDPANYPFGKHQLVQTHEGSGRTNLYIASHGYKIEGMPVEESQAEIKRLMDHCQQPKYVYSAEWKNPGDLIIWDNTCVMHRSTPGAYEGKHMRDMRRTTVHDSSKLAWGMNKVGDTWRSGLP